MSVRAFGFVFGFVARFTLSLITPGTAPPSSAGAALLALFFFVFLRARIRSIF
jgi:MYXO-CTERM domain-containing protein